MAKVDAKADAKADAYDIIKNMLDAKVIECCIVPQDNGGDIVMEKCIIKGDYKVVIVHDKNKSVVIC